MRLSLLHKSIIIIGVNLLITIGLALGAREFIQIPRYNALEDTLDKRQYDQVNQSLQFYHRQLSNNIWSIAQLIGAVRPHLDDQGWHQLVTRLALHPRFSTLDTVSVVDPRLDEPWVFTSPQAMPDAPRENSTQLDAFLSYLRPRMLHAATDGGVVNIGGEPILYSASVLGGVPVLERRPYIVVLKRLDRRFLAQIQTALGVEAELVSRLQWDSQVIDENVARGKRQPDGYTYMRLNSPEGGYAAWLRFRTPQRLYEDPYFTYASFVPLIIMVLLWALTVISIYRRVIQPIRGISLHLSQIRESSDYSARLNYAEGDEIQSLASECNDLISHVDEHTQALRKESNTDGLTGLANRRFFDQQIESYWSMASRSDRSLALVIFDIDHFKRVNDERGHPVGDAVLQQFSTVLRQTFRRSSDVVARIGGEEFAALMFDVPADDALALCETALAITRRRKLDVGLGQEIFSITASAGLSLSTPKDEGRYTELLNRADELLYQAKTTGRDRLCSDCDGEEQRLDPSSVDEAATGRVVAVGTKATEHSSRELGPEESGASDYSPALSSKPCS